jgi:transcriptional regulator with XRE-family HTH domain
MDQFRQIISRAVFLARDRAGLSQIDLAKAVGIDRSTLSDIEKGVRGCSLENACRIAQACGTKLTTLFRELDELEWNSGK